MERTILHSDANCFYASVEHLHHPELAGKPVAVGGDEEKRHGIILTADYEAKRCGVKAGMALWEAKKACPGLVLLPPRADLYLRFSRIINSIYGEYTDFVEPFGVDESWMDVSGSASVRGDGERIAKEISERIRKELGITVSIGISYNKIFAKLGSDYKKPDAITTMYRKEKESKIWPLPVSDLLYVGKATADKFVRSGIKTIGDLAKTDENVISSMFGKVGTMLWCFANGYDTSPVKKENTGAPVKSIGNSTTARRDLQNDEDVKIVIYMLAESVGARLRKNGFRCRVVEISIRNNELETVIRQHKIDHATNITSEIAAEAFRIFKETYTWEKAIRGLGVRGADLVTELYCEQLDLFSSAEIREKKMKADAAVDSLRGRFGYFCVQRGIMHEDTLLSSIECEKIHAAYPGRYYN